MARAFNKSTELINLTVKINLFLTIATATYTVSQVTAYVILQGTGKPTLIHMVPPTACVQFSD